jgi:putative transcriptional regulator
MVYTSSNMQSLHETAAALAEAKLFDTKTMRKLDSLCLSSAPVFDSAACVRIRKSTGTSQSVFAGYLNVSTSTVSKWETGVRCPGDIACRMLQLVERHGLALFD